MAPLLSHLRRPLSTRTLPNSPSKATRIVSGSKRARSPEHGEAQGQRVLKRARVLAPPPVIVPTRDLRKERERKTEREQQEAEFREKYTRAFPTWKFYFDTEKPLSISESSLKSRVLSLGSVCRAIFVPFDNNSSLICRELSIFSIKMLHTSLLTQTFRASLIPNPIQIRRTVNFP